MPRRNNVLKHFRFQPSGSAVCRLKQRYNDKQQAEAAADIATALEPNLSLRVYQCPRCLSWHLTKARG